MALRSLPAFGLEDCRGRPRQNRRARGGMREFVIRAGIASCQVGDSGTQQPRHFRLTVYRDDLLGCRMRINKLRIFGRKFPVGRGE